MQERLDRAYATTPWQVMFPEERVFHLQVLYSNHDPILLNMQLVTQQHQARKNQHHRFEERWVARLDCENVIREAWSYNPLNGNPMFKLFEKIKHCRHNLVAWSHRTFSNTKSKIEEKQNELKELINLGYATNLE